MRSKEVGVRKILGAYEKSLWFLLSSDFSRLIIIAISISLPVSWFLMRKWLDNFANQIDLNFGMFIFPALLLILISMATDSYHTLKTARLNLASTLKEE